MTTNVQQQDCSQMLVILTSQPTIAHKTLQFSLILTTHISSSFAPYKLYLQYNLKITAIWKTIFDNSRS